MSRRADLPLTLQSAVQMLEWGTCPENAPCSHEQIAAWCHRFWHQYIERDVPPEIGKILPILTDVETRGTSIWSTISHWSSCASAPP